MTEFMQNFPYLHCMRLLDLFWPMQEYAPYYEDYRRRVKSKANWRTPIEALRFVVFDTETTGLNPRTDVLLSIGAVEVQQQQIQVDRIFDCQIHREASIHQKAETIEVHGILPGVQESDWPERQAVEAFLDFLGDGILVAHHVAFDVQMIEKSLAQHQGGKLYNHLLDTAALAKELSRGGPKAFDLDSLGRRYGIPLQDRHTATGDAYITAVLLLKLLNRLKKRRVATLGDLLRLQKR